jgi:DNA-binding response OmpR family regulator
MTKHIMIVDDNPAVLDLYGGLFERRGYVVLAALDGASALDMLQKSTPSLFILDVMMPGINGIDLCQQLRALPQHEETPVLILSAWGDPKTIEQTFAAGANDYLVKPVPPHDLLTRVRDLLGEGDR